MRFPEISRALADVLSRHRIDVVQLEYGALASYVPLIRRVSPHTRIVVDELEVMSVALERLIAADGGTAADRSNLARWRRFEPRAWESCDAVLAMSAEEAAVVDRAAGAGKSAVVPNGVDTDYFAFEQRRTEGPPTLLFVGNLRHSPNALGLRRFLSDVWPGLARAMPELRLSVVGTGADQTLLHYENERVRFLGFVDDIRPHLSSCRFMVVPILSGGGTRLKVLEAMAAGAPVVSTPLGCEGLCVNPGAKAILADFPGAFEKAVSDGLGRPAALQAVARAARRHMEENYGWPSVCDKLEAVWRSVLTHQAPKAP